MDSASFNGKHFFLRELITTESGTLRVNFPENKFNFQVGAQASDTIEVDFTGMIRTLGVNFAWHPLAFRPSPAAYYLERQSYATHSSRIVSADRAIASISEARTKLGALQNRFEHTINSLSVTAENLAAAESRIRDTDMAMEVMSLTRAQILSQASMAILAQANTAPNQVLKLLS